MAKHDTAWRIGLLRGGLAIMTVVFAAGAMVLPGCITAAASYAVIHVVNSVQYTADTELAATPETVYQTMLRLLAERKDVTVDKRDDAKRQVEFSKGKNKATATVRLLDDGHSSGLKVTASENETDMSHEELALKIVQRVCDELGVTYKVAEKKSVLSR